MVFVDTFFILLRYGYRFKKSVQLRPQQGARCK